MSSASLNAPRRRKKPDSLDIDRRSSPPRRDDDRRVWLDRAYENIYIPAYVNVFHPYFEATIHAFTNLIEEAAQAEWVAQELAEADAHASRSMRSIKDFALEMIRRGLVVDEKGVDMTATQASELNPEHMLLKTGA